MLQKEEIDRLRRIVRDTALSAQERTQAFEQLQQYASAVLEADRIDYDRAYNDAPEQQAADLQKHRIYTAITQKAGIAPHTKPVRSLYGRWQMAGNVAAAVAVVLGLLLVYQYTSRPAQNETRFAVTEPYRVNFDTLFNNNDNTRRFLLPDSTCIDLAPRSYVYFQKNFSSGAKLVYLNGEAQFSVCKKDGRPFSVYVNDLEVRDLGTVFHIKSQAHKLQVQLIQGKVLLHALKPSLPVPDIALVPGQEFTMNTVSGKYSLHFYDQQDKQLGSGRERLSKHAIPPAVMNMKEMLLDKALLFNNTPIDEVLKSVGKEFNVTIKIDKQQSENLLFTGQFTEYMSLSQILDVITRSYDLQTHVVDSSIILNAVKK